MKKEPRFCSNCGKQTAVAGDSVFIEKGEYDGKHYAEEGPGTQYTCTNNDCLHTFVEWDVNIQ